MTLMYSLLGSPRTIEDLVQYAKGKRIPAISIKTSVTSEENVLVRYVANLEFNAGKKVVRQKRVYESGFSSPLANIELDTHFDAAYKAAVAKALEQADYLESQGLKATINNKQPSEIRAER